MWEACLHGHRLHRRLLRVARPRRVEPDAGIQSRRARPAECEEPPRAIYDLVRLSWRSSSPLKLSPSDCSLDRLCLLQGGDQGLGADGLPLPGRPLPVSRDRGAWRVPRGHTRRHPIMSRLRDDVRRGIDARMANQKQRNGSCIERLRFITVVCLGIASLVSGFLYVKTPLFFSS